MTHLKFSIIIVFATGLMFTGIQITSAQEAEEQETNYGISWSGFVKNDFFYDSRQTISVRERHFLLYPSPVDEDPDGKDINDRGSMNFLSIQTRLAGNITGPDAFGAKTSGKIEGAFFGHSDPDINGFRLRHAFVKLDWGKTQLLTGQYWHMMFVTDCFPGTISFNTGVPFQYFSRNPQIRLSQQLTDNVKFSLAAAMQRDFASPGGFSALSNSMMPDIQAQLQINAGESLLAGVTGGYKQMLPRLETMTGYKTDQKVGGFTANSYLKITTSPVTFKLQGIFAQNAYDGLMIGGYAIKEITDVDNDYRNYTPVNTMSVWTDIHSNGKAFSAGLFAGYSKNMGATDKLNMDDSSVADLFGSFQRGANIDYLMRVSPRLMFNSGKFRVATELEYTMAAYASSDDDGNMCMNDHGAITESETVSNLRVLLAVYYFF
ncbi:MAG: hypothetical protein ACOCVX_04420 [Bacteroidales bacterium]